MSKWKPIESAPRDGSIFLGFVRPKFGLAPEYQFQIMRWSGWGGGVFEGMGKYYEAEVSHWRPLPSPPTSDTA